MLRGSGGAYGPATITSGTVRVDDGTVGAPALGPASLATSGFYVASSVWNYSAAGNYQFDFNAAGIGMKSSGMYFWRATGAASGSADTSMTRAGVSNSILFGPGSTATTTTRTELNKAVTGITNAAATDVLTVTIPNAAHSACLEVEVIGSLGAGGAVGANEATASNTYKFVITRTAGVATVVATSAAFGAAAAAVAGAATVTCTAAATAMTGVVSAQQTFTVQVTISRSAGSSTNHTCLVYAKLMNANVTGITIA